MVGGTDSINLKLNNVMTLAHAKAFHEEALAALDDPASDTVWIDAVANEAIELPILQILVAVVNRAKEKGLKVVWDNPSIALFERSVELGLDEALKI